MKCNHTYGNRDKECPYEAQEGKDVCIWHEKVEDKDLKGGDFAGLDLDEAYLVRANMDSANMERCSLANANLQGASLEEAKLSGIRAKEANFSRAEMRMADLRSSFLKYANFEGAIMANCYMNNSDLSWANFNNAIMTGAQLDRSSLLDASLKNAILLHSSLRNAVMRGAELDGADLQIADLREADLRGTNLKGSNIRGADLRNTDLKYSNLEGVILSNSNLQEADFAKAHLKNVYMQGASLQRANFRDSNIENAGLEDANLEDAILRGANLKGADISNANLHNADTFNTKIEGMKNLRYAKVDDILITERRANDAEYGGENEEALRLYDEAVSMYIDFKNYFNGEDLYNRSGQYYIREWIVKGRIQRITSKIESERLKENKFLRYYLPISFGKRDSRAFTVLAKVESWGNWALNKLLYHTSRYGESPTRVLGTSLALILLYAFVYWYVGGISMGDASFIPSFKESLYFSAVTFTTLGYGDYQPKPDFQLLAISEAFLGAFVLAFFVVVVSRKLIR
ncbi:MAG TPA: pentapeptide repeat-containing protein [Candidatus Methanofastidiosa archaeon]|nr:pentapeptide repeat-containing protein [Candidatus Methanofastidiosa archaeon]